MRNLAQAITECKKKMKAVELEDGCSDFIKPELNMLMSMKNYIKNKRLMMMLPRNSQQYNRYKKLLSKHFSIVVNFYDGDESLALWFINECE